MSLELNNYFLKPEKFPLAGFLDGIKYPHEILIKAKAVLDEMFEGDEGCRIGEGSSIGDHVVIKGPVYIGRNVTISAHAYIRPYTIIGDNCSVGHGSEVKHTVMFAGAKVASLSCALDSVLGASARLGSGVITGNRRFDQGDISIRIDGERYELGGDYFGLVLGDAARLGANCTTQPGTHIGHHTWIYPQTAVRGYIPPMKRVYAKTELAFEDNAVVELKP